jgi:uncharacterized Zn ribbon protein
MWCTCPKCGSAGIISIDGGYVCDHSWCDWISEEVEYDTIIQRFPVRAGMAMSHTGKSSSRIKIVGYDTIEFRVSKLDGMLLKQIKLHREMK